MVLMYYVTAYICSTFFTQILQDKKSPTGCISMGDSTIIFLLYRFLQALMCLFHHSLFDNIVVTQQFFHYRTLHYAKQRLLQCI